MDTLEDASRAGAVRTQDLSAVFGKPLTQDLSAVFGKPLTQDLSAVFGKPLTQDLSAVFGKPLMQDLSAHGNFFHSPVGDLSDGVVARTVRTEMPARLPTPVSKPRAQDIIPTQRIAPQFQIIGELRRRYMQNRADIDNVIYTANAFIFAFTCCLLIVLEHPTLVEFGQISGVTPFDIGLITAAWTWQFSRRDR